MSLEFLNRVNQAWVEMEYNRSRHEELSCLPLDRFLKGPDVSRPSPDTAGLSFAFTVCESRTQRQSDGTIQVKGVRFEIPSRCRHFKRLHIRYRNWDLSKAWVVDQQSNSKLAEIYPLDKSGNNSGARRTLASPMAEQPPVAGGGDSPLSAVIPAWVNPKACTSWPITWAGWTPLLSE